MTPERLQERRRALSLTPPGLAAQPAFGGDERRYDIMDLRAEIRRLTAARARLSASQQRLAKMRQTFEALLAPHAARMDVLARRQLAADAAAAAAADAQQRRQRLEAAMSERNRLQESLSGRFAAFSTALKTLGSARGRLCDAEAALAGPDGRGRWRQLQRQLVSRRNVLVVRLARLYHLGPAAASPLQAPSAPPLLQQLDNSWLGSDASTNSYAVRSSGGAGAAPRAPSPSPAAARVPAPSAPGTLAAGPAAPTGASKAPPRLSIRGLELPPALLHSPDAPLGSGHLDEEFRVGVALGYLAHMLDRLAAYLDVPLRYPLTLGDSKSSISDPAPPLADGDAEGWLGAGGTARGSAGGALDIFNLKRRLAGRTDANGSVGAPIELPLYLEGEARARCVAGMRLLSKNVEALLEAHGLAASGNPERLLHDVWRLVLAAEGGVAASAAAAEAAAASAVRAAAVGSAQPGQQDVQYQLTYL